MEDKDIRLILQALTLVLPINIYVIGNWLGAGAQWALVRYQIAPSYGTMANPYGTSVIPVTGDFGFVLSGIMSGRSGASLLVWSGGAVLLVTALLLMIYAHQVDPDIAWVTRAPVLTIAGGVMFLASCIMQYGLFLHGSAGFTIPVGVPLVIAIGWWTYRHNTGAIEVSRDSDAAVEEV